ncbi:MAG: Na/Pi cotransporter family protein [Erysipelotrichaceae bacterium]|nr:Na/Pi cotransporter family protein [Erysipelotrichaceae bacterium]
MTLASLDWGMILGGFGLFMFGIKFMGDGLKAAAGDRLKDLINKYTSNRISALLIGIVLTIIMQSSSATSAISIGLVRASLMTLEQAAGIILGATIGTTVTSFLISISIEKYAMFIIFAGCALICFAKKVKLQQSGSVILGFGLIFFGMAAMGDALAALKELPQFESIALKMSEQPVLALLAGILLTAAVQSSAATIGVIQKLYMAGAVTFSASLPFMFGANIGTTMTGILASIGGSTEGKRTAALHTTLNVISTIFGMLLLKPYASFIQAAFGGLNPMMQIAMANIVFKTVTTLLFVPFLNQLVAFVKKIIPGEEKESYDYGFDQLETDLGAILPSAAVDVAKQAILKMVDIVRYNTSEALVYMKNKGDETLKEKIAEREGVINQFDLKITEYLIQLSKKPNLTINDTDNIRSYLDALKNFERVGDLTQNLIEFFDMAYEKKEEFTPKATAEMEAMFEQLLKMFDVAAEVFVTGDEEQYEKLRSLEHDLDKMELDARRHHFRRMRDGECTTQVASSVYCDIIGTLERMGDHCCNVGKSTVTGLTSDLSDDEMIPA